MKYIIILFLLSFCCVNAQNENIEGKIIYNMEVFGRKSVASLDFSSTSSLYYVLSDKKNAYKVTRENDLVSSVEIDTTDSYIFTDRSVDSLYLKRPCGFSKRKAQFCYLYERLPQIEWEVVDEVKTILNVKCRKAVGSFRGRTYTTWYAISIPAYFGPWKLSGLPGVILEVRDDKSEVFFQAEKIIIPNKYKKISLDPKIKKVKLDTSFVNGQKKQLDLFLKQMNARANRGGVKTEMKKQTIELNYDDVNY